MMTFDEVHRLLATSTCDNSVDWGDDYIVVRDYTWWRSRPMSPSGMVFIIDSVFTALGGHEQFDSLIAAAKSAKARHAHNWIEINGETIQRRLEDYHKYGNILAMLNRKLFTIAGVYETLSADKSFVRTDSCDIVSFVRSRGNVSVCVVFRPKRMLWTATHDNLLIHAGEATDRLPSSWNNFVEYVTSN